jgi:hypothetical protein
MLILNAGSYEDYINGVVMPLVKLRYELIIFRKDGIGRDL